MKPEQERVKNLLTDTVALLCRNGLQFQRGLKIQGLLGITIDESEVFLVSLDEKIESVFVASSEADLTSHSQAVFPQPVTTSLMSMNSSPGSSFGKFSLKSSRPIRPASRFGRQPFLTAQKRHRKLSATHTNLSNSSIQSSSAAAVSVEERLPLENRSDDLPFQVKREEDDDVILVNHERNDIKMQSDDRAAMLGSYATELSGREAQDLFNEFSSLTAPPLESGGPFVGGIVRNFASQSSVNISSEQLNSSLPGNSVSWDVGNGQSSQPFISSPNKTLPTVGYF